MRHVLVGDNRFRLLDSETLVALDLNLGLDNELCLEHDVALHGDNLGAVGVHDFLAEFGNGFVNCLLIYHLNGVLCENRTVHSLDDVHGRLALAEAGHIVLTALLEVDALLLSPEQLLAGSEFHFVGVGFGLCLVCNHFAYPP